MKEAAAAPADAALHKFGDCDLKQLMMPQPGLPDKGQLSYTVKNEGLWGLGSQSKSILVSGLSTRGL